MTDPAAPVSIRPFGLYVLKVASRCNLNCSYCYVYHKADMSWRQKPALMSEQTYEAALGRILRHCRAARQRSVRLSFHGGEPMLLGARRFDSFCARAREVLADVADVELSIQTNGTKIDANWIEVFVRHNVRVGVSLDGLEADHDRYRVDHRGRGSYQKIMRGLQYLRAADIPWGMLAVIQPGVDPLPIHREFATLSPQSISYLWPDYTHDTIGNLRERFGPTPAADFIVPLYDEWLSSYPTGPHIQDFWNVTRLVLGGDSVVETFGNAPSNYAFVETDGEIEGLDVLKICEEGMGKTGLNVLCSDFSELGASRSFAARAIMEGLPLPTACRVCPEQLTCAGGYLPHRYSRQNSFDNPSVWCADILEFFRHVRSTLGISSAETDRRRAALARRVRQDSSVGAKP